MVVAFIVVAVAVHRDVIVVFVVQVGVDGGCQQ